MLLATECSVCGDALSREVFHGPVRAGAPGTVTKDEFSVHECPRCKTRRLSPFPGDVETFYESERYRDAYNRSHDSDQISAMHVDIRVKMVERLGLARLFGRTVAEFGCAEGGVLDLVSGAASETIAVEPAAYFHSELERKGHEVFSYGSDLVKSGQKADVVMSFETIEHVADPLEFTAEMHAALKDGGQLVLTTPNADDILDQLVPESFRPFNHRTAHLYYFTAQSLRTLFERVGFREITIGFLHLFDLSNLLGWCRDRKPTGLGRIPLFGEQINAPWRAYLEQIGRASNLWAEAVK